MSERFTKGMARNIYYGGGMFFKIGRASCRERV